tara:strand:+ start:223 stop:522 length:300 start_codon:yes stop_codon:yes gene_type:complete
MAAYIVVDVEIKDMEEYKSSGYIENVPKIVAKYGGRYLARGGATKVHEGVWQPRRLVIIEFPSMEKLETFYSSEEYAPYLAIRKRLGDSNLVATEGLPT